MTTTLCRRYEVRQHLGKRVEDILQVPAPALEDSVVFIYTLGSVLTYYQRVHPVLNKEFIDTFKESIGLTGASCP
jgi:hypothetical protein